MEVQEKKMLWDEMKFQWRGDWPLHDMVGFNWSRRAGNSFEDWKRKKMWWRRRRWQWKEYEEEMLKKDEWNEEARGR